MILCLGDYKRFPHAKPDFATRNRSFVEYAATLKAMGNKNWMWPLMVLNEKLLGVDPHDPDLDDETKVLIRIECRWNPIYALRECIRIPSGGDSVPFEANRGNMAMVWCFFNNLDTFYMQIRQTGKTTTIYVLLNICTNMVQRGCKSLLVTKDHQLRKTNIAELKKIRDLLPDYLNPYKAGVDMDNQESITVARFQNFIYTAVGRKDPNGANGIGRGITCALTGFDEPPFTPNIQISYGSAVASGNTARETALINGMPASVFMCTTAGQRDRKEGRFCYDKQMSAARFTERFMDIWDRKKLHSVVRNQSRGDVSMVNIEYDHLQLGKSNEWLYENVKKAFTGDIEAINRDFFNIWSNGSGRSPLTKHQKDAVVSDRCDVTYLEILNDEFVINWYCTEDEIPSVMRTHHVMSLDTSDAVGNDDIAIAFTNSETGETTATMSFNEANLVQAGNMVGELMVRFQRTTMIIEAKSSARTFVDAVIIKLLENGMDPFRRMFNNVVQNQDDPAMGKIFHEIRGRVFGIATYMRHKKYFGFNTTQKLRDTLYGPILSRTLSLKGAFKDNKMSSQVLGLSVKNNRMDHSSGEHDDLVISKLLGIWFLVEGRNMKYYGIDPSRILSKAKKNGAKQLSPVEQRSQSEMESYQEELTELKHRFETARSPLERDFITRRMKVIKLKLGDRDVDASISIDQYMDRAAKESVKKVETCTYRVY